MAEPTCIALAERFGQRYRIVYEEQWAEWPAAERPWLARIACKYGHVGVQGGDRLHAARFFRPAGDRSRHFWRKPIAGTSLIISIAHSDFPRDRRSRDTMMFASRAARTAASRCSRKVTSCCSKPRTRASADASAASAAWRAAVSAASCILKASTFRTIAAPLGSGALSVQAAGHITAQVRDGHTSFAFRRAVNSHPTDNGYQSPTRLSRKPCPSMTIARLSRAGSLRACADLPPADPRTDDHAALGSAICRVTADGTGPRRPDEVR